MPLSRITAASISDGTVVAADIADGAVTGPKLGATSINANNIVNATITGAKLAANTVTGDVIGQNAVSSNNIVNSTITTTQIASNTISNTNIQTGAIENYVASTGRPLTNRNIVINGDMQIVQRNANTVSITTDGYYSPDRWLINVSSAGTWTMNVDSVGVNRAGPTGSEFGNSCNLICTTADSSLSAGDFLIFSQRIEGLNTQGIKKGSASAESITVSFWAKSSNTGTYVCELFDNDNTRQISRSYTVNSADTWEKKTLTFTPDTSGRLDNDNLFSLGLNFWLGAGTTWTSGTLNTSWASITSANRAVGQLNLANRAGNYFAITGIQMELGTVATPFEKRSYGADLALCQRYALKYNPEATIYGYVGVGFAGATTYALISLPLPVQMRTAPTLTSSNLMLQDGQTITAVTSVAIVTNQTNSLNAYVQASVASGLTLYRPYQLQANNNTAGNLILSAEL